MGQQNVKASPGAAVQELEGIHSFLGDQLQKIDQQNLKANAGATVRKPYLTTPKNAKSDWKSTCEIGTRRVATEHVYKDVTSKPSRLSLHDLKSERIAVVQRISKKIQTARRSARQTLNFSLKHYLFEENDLVRIEEALFQAHLTSDASAVRSISAAVKEIGDGLVWNFGRRTRSVTAIPCHLSVDETKKKIEDLVARIDENRLVQFSSRAGLPLELADVSGKDYALDNDDINYFLHNQMPCENVASYFPEVKRAQMVDWVFLISRVLEIPDESCCLAVHLLDKALLVDKNISEMSDVENRVVMVAAVKIAEKFENGMWDRLKSAVCNDKLQCQKGKINQWEFQLLKFFDFPTKKNLLHFLHIFWLLMGDVMSGTEKENGWATVKGLAYIAMAKASLMNNNPSLVAAAIMRIALHLFLNRRKLSEDKFLQIISRLLHEESQYVPIATSLLNWVLSSPTYIPTIAFEFETNQYHPSVNIKQELETIVSDFDKYFRRG